jgi:hypothetical protein
LAVQCRATKRDGSPCTLPSNGSSGLCWAHDPKNAERRRRGQSRGGRTKPIRELVEAKAAILTTIEDVRTGALNKSVGAVMFQGYGTLIRVIEQERKAKETEDLEARIEALERSQEKGDRSWRQA